MGKTFYKYWILIFAILLCSVSVIILIISASKKEKIEIDAKNDASGRLFISLKVIQNYFEDIDKQFIYNGFILETLDGMELSLGENDYVSRKKRSNLLEYISTLNVNYDVIERVTIYYKDENALLTKGGIFEKSQYDSKDLLDYIDQLNINTAWYSIRWIESEDSYATIPVISYIRQLPVVSYKKSAVFIVDINLKEISEMLNSMLPEDNTGLKEIYFLDDQGTIIIDSKTEKIGKSLYEFQDIIDETDDFTNQFFVFLNNNRILITCEQEMVSGLKALILMPVNNASMLACIKKMLPLYLILIVVSLFVSYFLSKFLYKPLDRLLKTMEAGKIHSKFKEYSFIETGYINLFEKNNINEKRMDICIPLLKKYIENTIFKENGFVKKIPEDILLICGYTSAIRAYAVMAIRIEGKDTLSEEDINIADHVINMVCKGFVWQYDQNIVCIIELSGEDVNLNYEHTIQYIVEELIIVNDKFKIGASRLYDNLDELCSAYEDAKKVLDYNVAYGNRKIFADDALEGSSKKFMYPYDLENTLINSIKKGEKARIAFLLDSFFDKVMDSTNSLDQAKKMSVYLSKALMRIMYNYGFIHEELILHCQLEEKIHSTTTVSEMRSIFHNTCFKIVDSLNSKRNTNVNNIVADIVKYIDRHLCDSGMSLSILAERQSVSLSYLSRMFKETTGLSFVEYVNIRRIEKAKQLLNEDKLLVKEIADKVGMSAQTLIRVFKQHENVTPSQYCPKTE